MSRRDLVPQGWDKIGPRYLEWSLASDWEPRRRYLAYFMDALPDRAKVLELGCGAGLPVTRMLAERHLVTAFDVSPGQVELARVNVPSADVRVGDMTEIELPEQSFGGAAAFYSLLHVPRERQRDLFARVFRWLEPGGAFVATLATHDVPQWIEDDWLGAPMFFSSFDADTSRRLLGDVGFELERDEVLAQIEFGKEVRFLWVLARRP